MMITFLRFLMLSSFALFAAVATAQTDPQPSANDLQELSRLLADDRIQQWLEDQIDQTETLSDAPVMTLRDQFQQGSQAISARFTNLGEAWRHRAEIGEVIGSNWRAQLPPSVQVRSLSFVLIFLFIGFGLEWLMRQYTNPTRRRLEVTQYTSARDRLLAALYRAGIAFLGLIVFALGSVGAFSAFEWPPLLNTLILDLLLVIVATRATGSLLLLFLAPWAEQLRLVPVNSNVALTLWRIVLAIVAVMLVSIAAVDIFDELTEFEGRQAPETLAVAVLSAVVLLLVIAIGLIAVFRTVQTQESALSLRAIRGWRAFLLTISVVSFALWLVDVRPLMWTVILLGLLFPTLALVSAWVSAGFQTMADEFQAKRLKERKRKAALARKVAEAAAEAAGEPAPPLPEDDEDDDDDDVVDPYQAYTPLAVRLARFSVIIIVGLILAAVWNVGVFERADDPSVSQRVFEILLDSAFALLIADLVWTWGKSVIDRRLANYKPPTDNKAPGPEARMATLLPLLRVVLQVTLLSMVVMTLLTAAGVNIAPIIAGAGVIGIAIGFGAQSLVKDVVSGIFFLIDDAFRVGEYVEIDSLRGTVEKISIRSLQLRHHRGAVHTLPFGELKSLTNHSRDWVIMKLEFRVPFDTDLKLVKKLVKQVGAQLAAHPEYGDSIIQTLKSQGVRRMEEFNMVVGVKFMTRPGEQWLVRRDAYMGVRDIFEANGIRMAERNVKVEIAGDEDLTDEQKHAVAAAAQQSVEQQLPPKPTPDEP